MLNAIDQAAWTERVRAGLSDANVSREQVRRDEVEYVDFYEYFAGYCKRLLDRQKSLWKREYEKWLRNALYYDGKQILVPRRGGFGYDVKQLSGIDQPLYVYNKLRPYSDEVTSMWVQSNPEILFAALDEDDRRADKALAEIELLNEYWNYLHFTEEVRQDTAKGAQFCGNYHFEVWFDPNAKNGFEWIEEFAPLQIPESLWYECLDCGQMGEMPESGACPHCQSQMITPHVMPAVNVPDAIPTRAEWQQAGEIVVKPGPAWAQRYNLVTGASNSPWRYVEEDLPKEVIEFTYGKLDPAACKEAWGADEDMHPARIMRRAERQRAGYEAEDDSDHILSQRFWYEPEMLHYFGTDRDTTLPSGEVIPARTRYSEAFAEGMLILTSPGLPRFHNVTRESHLERWVDGKYGIVFGKKTGHGNEDGTERQRQHNILESGKFRYYQKTLQPSIAVNNRVFKDSRLFNRADNVISTNNSTIPENTKLDDHFAYVAAPPINPQILLEREHQEADMQEALKAYTSQGDFAGIENNTATATKVGAAKEVRAHNVHLALYAGALKEVGIRRIALAQKHYNNLRVAASIDQLRGKRKVSVINAVDIRCQFVAWIKVGSFMPNLDIEKRASFIEATTAATALAGIGMLNPASLQSINKRFGTDLTFERLNERVEECEETLDLMLQAFAQTQGMITPEELYMLAPVDPAANGHEAKLFWWRDWLSSKEGRTAPEAIKEAARIYVGQEFAALQMEQQYLAMLMNTGPAVAAMQNAQIEAMGDGQNGGNSSKGSNVAGSENPMMSEPSMLAPTAALSATGIS